MMIQTTPQTTKTVYKRLRNWFFGTFSKYPHRDKDRIYKWLLDATVSIAHHTVGAPCDTFVWKTPGEIAGVLDIPTDRVRDICMTDNRIQRQEYTDLWRNQRLDERWAARENVR